MVQLLEKLNLNEKQKNLVVFVSSLFFAVFLARVVVYFFFMQGTPVYREVSGLAVHHLHFGVIFIIIALFLFIFQRVSLFSVFLAGFGLGLLLDEFVPSLYLNTVREEELVLYASKFPETLILIAFIGAIGQLFYWFFCLRKK